MTDLNGILGLVASNISAQYLGYRSDRDRAWAPFVVGCVVFALPWSGLLASFYGSAASSDDMPEFVYALNLTLTLLYAVFPTILALRLARVIDVDDRAPWFRSSEHLFDLASFVSKFLLDWILIAGIIGW